MLQLKAHYKLGMSAHVIKALQMLKQEDHANKRHAKTSPIKQSQNKTQLYLRMNFKTYLEHKIIEILQVKES